MDWAEIVGILVNSLILPILAWGVSELTKYFSKRIKNETAEKYVNFAVDAVYTAVQTTMQIFVSTLKNSGEWNAEAAKTAFDHAKALALVTMGEDVREAITEISGDLDAWIEARIEATIAEIKEEKK